MVKRAYNKVKREIRNKRYENKYGNHVIKILLLTNRDSDNTGDQVIEACDISLIHAVMANLSIPRKFYTIDSHAASIVTKEYVAKRDEKMLKNAENLIKDADMVIFGGAPMFNYTYQIFYERTAITIELCKKYNVPVIFSAIGIEYYRQENEKCQRITEAVNLDVVKQITTRDDFESLEKMKKREDLVVAKVSDPAVFSNRVLRNFKADVLRENSEDIVEQRQKKKIGLFAFRAFGFKDNGYDFSPEQAIALWKDLLKEFEDRGYEAQFITNGHYGDEAFLDSLVRQHGVPVKKCVFNINMLDDLIPHLSDYDGIVSCRLHPSIISYSMGIPSVGLKWNMKVQGFYDAIGYGNRVIPVEELTASHVADVLEEAMKEGVKHDRDFQLSVYEYLFHGIKNILGRDGKCYTYEELLEALPPFNGTSKKEAGLKIERKLRRSYEGYNRARREVLSLKEEKKGR